MTTAAKKAIKKSSVKVEELHEPLKPLTPAEFEKKGAVTLTGKGDAATKRYDA